MNALLLACLLAGDGRTLFVARCGKCHDADGTKPLPKGAPLAERQLSEAQVAKSVAGRFADASPAQKRAVTRYILSFMKPKAPALVPR